MRLSELNPKFLAGGASIRFDCPRPTCTHRIVVPFDNPVDGSAARPVTRNWYRTGTTVENLSLYPSVIAPCGAHFTVSNGEIVPN